jgi:predicted DNA-binding transcriptional regulator YafY
MRGDQLARQWRLIQRLAKSRAGVSPDDLAEDLGCVRRTVYRDLDALMYAGFPVVSEKRDGHVYYRFLDTFGIGDVPFTPDEILALAFGEDLLRTLEGTVFHDSVQSALGKIRAGLSPELSGFLEQLGESFRVLPGPHKRYRDQRDTIQVLNDAVLAKRTVQMRYRTGRTGETASRKLDPYRVWYRSGGLYVVGHDHRSGEVRTFAVERIRKITPTDESFAVRDDFDFDAYVGQAFGVMSEPATTVKIRFSSEWATHVEERTWHPSQTLRRLRGGGVELEMEVGGQLELKSWVLSFGAGAEVLEPESLREAVRAELARALDAYGPRRNAKRPRAGARGRRSSSPSPR